MQAGPQAPLHHRRYSFCWCFEDRLGVKPENALWLNFVSHWRHNGVFYRIIGQPDIHDVTNNEPMHRDLGPWAKSTD